MRYLEEDLYKNIGKALRDARENVNLTLAEVATKIGVTPMTVQRYEKGQRKITVEKIKAVCELYNIDSNFIMQQAIDAKMEHKDNVISGSSQINRLVDYARLLSETNLGRLIERATILLEEQRAIDEEVVAEVFHIVEPYVGEFEDEVREIAEKSTKEALEKLINESGALAEFPNENDLGKCD